MLRSFDAADFPAERVAAAKRGRTVSVVIPARDEGATVAGVVGVIRTELMKRHGVVDELVVVDDGSTDGTAREAAAAGADVVTAADVLSEYGTEHGKGQALWRGVHVTGGDIVAFCDADVTGFGAGFVLGVVGPLLAYDDVHLVKGFYRRSFQGQPGEGGRVTELVARPLVSLLFPHLAAFLQPLAGECAARREVLEAVPFVGGYGVDLGLLIDVADRFGAGCLSQCDLGQRDHRNRPLAELRPQAAVILRLGLQRAGVALSGQPGPSVEPHPPRLVERPPLAGVPAYRKTA